MQNTIAHSHLRRELFSRCPYSTLLRWLPQHTREWHRRSNGGMSPQHLNSEGQQQACPMGWLLALKALWHREYSGQQTIPFPLALALQATLLMLAALRASLQILCDQVARGIRPTRVRSPSWVTRDDPVQFLGGSFSQWKRLPIPLAESSASGKMQTTERSAHS